MPSITYVRKIFRKTNISNLLIRTRIRGLEKLVFQNILRTYLINGWPLTHKNYFFPLHRQNRCALYKNKFRQVSSCYNNVFESWIFSANTPCVLHVETMSKRWFPRHFNLELTWCVSALGSIRPLNLVLMKQLSLSFSKNLVLVIFDGWKIVFSKNSNLPYLLLWWFWDLFLCIWLGKIVCWNLF